MRSHRTAHSFTKAEVLAMVEVFRYMERDPNVEAIARSQPFTNVRRKFLVMRDKFTERETLDAKKAIQ